MNEETISENLSSLKEPVTRMGRKDIISVRYTKVERQLGEKIENWLVNRISSLSGLQSLAINAMVEVYFKNQNDLHLLVLGVPEKLPGGRSFRAGWLLPGEMGVLPKEANRELSFWELFNEDPAPVRVAKNLANRIIKEEAEAK
jgi:hypothetical protein